VNALHSKATPEWYTPIPYVEAAGTVMGGIDLDPQSCAEANLTVQATRFLSKQDDCFRHSWFGRVWINPAGGIVKESWLYLQCEVAVGHTTEFVWCGYSLEQLQVLQNIPASRLGPVSFSRAICYCDHRIKFECSREDRQRMQAALDFKRAAAGKPLVPWKNSPTHGNFFAYYGPRIDTFQREFRQFGEVR
jgi:hypothetical protein